MWNTPTGQRSGHHFAWQICTSLRDMGAHSREGLDIVSKIWSRTDFRDTQGIGDTEAHTYEMAVALQEAGLISEKVEDEQLTVLYRQWQLPMYRIDFGQIEVPLEDLRSQRDRILWQEMGC